METFVDIPSNGIVGIKPVTNTTRRTRKRPCHVVSDEVYRLLAIELTNAIRGCLEWSGDIEITYKGIDYVLEKGRYLAYYRHIDYPEGSCNELQEILPMWAEMHAYREGTDEEVETDFHFNRINSFL